MSLTNERLQHIASWVSSGITAVIPTGECAEMAQRLLAAEGTLNGIGYTYNGGELWKPPVGARPNFNLLDAKQARIDELEAQLAELRGQAAVAFQARRAGEADWHYLFSPDHADDLKARKRTGHTWEFNPLYARPVPPAASNQDYICDSAYIAGLKAGYNLGVDENDTELNKCIENYRKQMIGAKPLAASQPDAMLCDFYEVKNYPDLVRELVLHVEQLQESAKRNVKPWQDTFPETLLPAYIERIKNADDAVRAASQPYTVPDENGITPHFDTIALETARMIMFDVNRREDFLGGDIQLLSRIQCRVDDACAAMLQSGNSPVVPIRYMNRITGQCFTLEQQPDAATDTDVYIPLVPQHKVE